MDTPGQNDMLEQIENYRSIVSAYESLNDKINKLLAKHSGGTENMSSEDLAHYRKLARQRDEALNEMRWLEQQLLDDSEQ